MPNRYFRVPEHSDGGKPKYKDKVDSWAGTTIGNSPKYIVRMYGTTTQLDDVAAQSDTQELTESEWVDQLNNASVSHLEGTGRPRDAEGWKRGWHIG